MKKIVILIFVTFMLFGCHQKECRPDIQIQYETQEVIKYKPCITQEPNCDFSGEGFIPTEKLLACVIEQKKIINVCK